jgi:EF hand
VGSVEEGYKLDDAEVKAAIKILDKDGDGLINFPEFVDWWVNKVRRSTLPSPPSARPSESHSPSQMWQWRAKVNQDRIRMRVQLVCALACASCARACVCVSVCVCVCARARAHAGVRVLAHACVHACVRVSFGNTSWTRRLIALGHRTAGQT